MFVLVSPGKKYPIIQLMPKQTDRAILCPPAMGEKTSDWDWSIWGWHAWRESPSRAVCLRVLRDAVSPSCPSGLLWCRDPSHLCFLLVQQARLGQNSFLSYRLDRCLIMPPQRKPYNRRSEKQRKSSSRKKALESSSKVSKVTLQ